MKAILFILSLLILAFLIWFESISYGFSGTTTEDIMVHYGILVFSGLIILVEYFFFFVKTKK